MRETAQKHFDFVLLGNGPASVSAADTLRAEGAKGSILLISEEDYPPYERTYLSKQFLLGTQLKERVLIHSEAHYRENAIELMLSTHVEGVDAASRLVFTARGEAIHFSKLLIATGSKALPLVVPGSTLPGIHYLHTLADAEALKRDVSGAARVAILGGGFLGIELAVSLAKLGVSPVLIEEDHLLLHQLASPELSEFFSRYCAARGITVRTNDSAASFKGESRVEAVVTRSGESWPCDLAIAAIGAVPEIDFLRGSGIELGDGIIVNQYLETNVPGIFAAGDVANFYDIVSRERRRIEHWDNAVKQGRQAARNMLGRGVAYFEVSYYFCNMLDLSFNFLGSAQGANEHIPRGSLDDRSFALLYLKDNVLRACFSMGRPPSETLAAELLIRDRTALGPVKDRLSDLDFALDSIPAQTVLILQGGGALGAFECGVVKALEEANIHPDVIAGVSIGAFNGAIIASNPDQAAAALEAFWNDLALAPPCAPAEAWRRAISSWWSIWFGSPNFFWPKWWLPPKQAPWNWTSLYDTTPARALLEKYVDFGRLKESPVRLLVSTVDIETAKLEVFDSYSDDITADHIMASGSLPPAFPWTTIRGRHYWDAGIVSNSPLDVVNERCGEMSKRVFIVDLFPSEHSLPGNLAEVLMRRDEIIYAERVLNDMRLRERISDFRALVEEVMTNMEPEPYERLRQSPRFIRLMADAAPTTITRIVNKVPEGEPAFTDNDFSMITVERHMKAGYASAKRALAGAPPNMAGAAS
jgi:NADPH-dependent 2,4-dienoyl-CoA reductase/sulfur reductase-like enzyme/predicted acylesterase/phospholipase RssA